MIDFKNILILCNPKTKDTETIQRALALLKNHQAKLTVVDVIQSKEIKHLAVINPEQAKKLEKISVEQRQIQIKNFLTQFGTDGERIQVEVLCGSPINRTLQKIQDDQHDLVMLTADAVGPIKDRALGSMSMSLIRYCPCPVWVVKPQARVEYKSILAAIDLTHEGEEGYLNEKILEASNRIAEQYKSEVHVLHACDFYLEGLLKENPLIRNAEVDKIAHDIWEEHEREFRMFTQNLKIDRLKTHYLKGDAGDLIVELSRKEDIDLVVIGTVNRANRHGITIGSTAEKVCCYVNSSILALKPDGFIVETV